MNIRFAQLILLIFLASCSNNTTPKQKIELSLLPEHSILWEKDSLSMHGSIIHVSPKDSTNIDSTAYSEIIMSIYDAHLKHRLTYRILDNQTNWLCVLKIVKCNGFISLGNAVVDWERELSKTEPILIPATSPYRNIPMKTLRAKVMLESDNDFGAPEDESCNCN